MEETPQPRKMDLFAETWANLALIRRMWPDDKSAFVRSGIMQADLAAELGAWSYAVNPLLEVLPAAAKSDVEPQVERRLGQAYEQMGNVADAERHFLAAERTMHSAHLNRGESQAILTKLGWFYSHHGKPREAIQRFREAQNLPGQDLLSQANFQLAILQQTVPLGKDAAAPEFARFDDLVAVAHRTTLSPGEAAEVNHMVQHAQRLRDKSNK
jgi:tetratricopeptide (TPR) repeat protein